MAVKHYCDCCKEQIGGGYGNEIHKLVISEVPSDKTKHWVNELCVKCVKKIISIAQPK